MKNKIIVVCGPTASGKTGLSIELAKILNAEIISADSMQIYKELNIGTAKPTVKEMSGIPHHLIDIISIKPDKSSSFSVADYVSLADDCVCDILNRNKRVIICGGTGLYIDHFINNTKFTEYENDIDYRLELEKLSSEHLYFLLSEADKKSAEIIHPNNKKRIIRALEIFKVTGKTKSELDELSNLEESKYDFVKIGLNYNNRENLYGRINKRVDLMIKDGLLEEARELYEKDEENNIKRIGAIGYAELLDYFNGLLKFNETVEKIKQHTRNYAKRQITWFKRDKKTRWADMDCVNNQDKIIKICLNYFDL